MIAALAAEAANNNNNGWGIAIILWAMVLVVVLR